MDSSLEEGVSLSLPLKISGLIFWGLALIGLMLIVLSISTSLSSFDSFYGNIKSFIMNNIIPVDSEVFSTFIDGFMQNSMQISIIGMIAIIASSMLFFQS